MRIRRRGAEAPPRCGAEAPALRERRNGKDHGESNEGQTFLSNRDLCGGDHHGCLRGDRRVSTAGHAGANLRLTLNDAVRRAVENNPSWRLCVSQPRSRSRAWPSRAVPSFPSFRRRSGARATSRRRRISSSAIEASVSTTGSRPPASGNECRGVAGRGVCRGMRRGRRRRTRCQLRSQFGVGDSARVFAAAPEGSHGRFGAAAVSSPGATRTRRSCVSGRRSSRPLRRSSKPIGRSRRPGECDGSAALARAGTGTGASEQGASGRRAGTADRSRAGGSRSRTATRKPDSGQRGCG